jgi:hypothetical protein
VDVWDGEDAELVGAREVVGAVQGKGREAELRCRRAVVEDEAAREQLVVGYLVAFDRVAGEAEVEEEAA